MKRFYYLVKHAQAICASCAEPSPVIPFRNVNTEAERDQQVIDGLLEAGWDVQISKAYCSDCRRMGRAK